MNDEAKVRPWYFYYKLLNYGILDRFKKAKDDVAFLSVDIAKDIWSVIIKRQENKNLGDVVSYICSRQYVF